jgi:hypothetical protein
MLACVKLIFVTPILGTFFNKIDPKPTSTSKFHQILGDQDLTGKCFRAATEVCRPLAFVSREADPSTRRYT